MNDDPDPMPAPAAPTPRTARFDRTGDSRVDDAVAALPEPAVHRRPTDSEDSGVEASLPDPTLLDEHIGDVTNVHRLLQQRLSDLSG